MFALSHHPDRHDVSFQEQFVLAGWRKNPDVSLGNSDLSFCTDLHVDPERLERSLTLACARHDALFTRFALDGEGRLRRYFLPTTQRLFVLQVTNCDASVEDPAVGEVLAGFCLDPFRVAYAEWLRVLLIHTADGGSALMFRLPHLITDATGISLFMADVWKLYEALSTGESVDIPKSRYSLQDYAASQQDWARTPEFEKQFNQQLANTVARMRELLELTPNPAPRRPRPIIAAEEFLSPDILSKLATLSEKTKVNIGTLLVACSVVGISRLYGQRAFCYRLPFSARTSRQVEGIVGFLSDDIVMFANLDPDMSFLQFVAQMHREAFRLMTQDAMPWLRIRERMKEQVADTLLGDYTINIVPPRRSYSENPLFQTRPCAFPVFGSAGYRLKLLITQGPKGTAIRMRLGEDERDRAHTVMLPQFMSTLRALVETPERSLGDALRAGEFE